MDVDESAARKIRRRDNLLVVLGPTASGKTGLAVSLARKIGGEIISADSRQVYRGMDIGTGKDLEIYGRGEGCVAAHLIDICDPAEEFSVFEFRERFFSCFGEISERGRFPVLAGGTGLYLDCVLRGYRMAAVPENRGLREQLAGREMESLRQRLLALRPEAHNSTDLTEKSRLIRAIEIAEFSKEHPAEGMTASLLPLVIGIRCPREELRRRITARLQARLKAGMVEEVRRLHDAGIGWQRLEAFGLEYRYIAWHLQGKMDGQEMFEMLNTRIHQFAKRQETWFRGMEKKGVLIHWIDGADEAAALGLLAGPGE